jgi:hypothetical protein
VAQYKTLQFENNAGGQAAKIQAINEHARVGWRVVSESISPGKFKGEKACCFYMIFAPCAFLAGSTDGTINVTLEHALDIPPPVSQSAIRASAEQSGDMRLGFAVLAGFAVVVFAFSSIVRGHEQVTDPPTASVTQTPQAPRDTIPFRVAQSWDIPNGGYGRIIVIDHRAVTDSGLRQVGTELLAFTRSDRNAFINVFDNATAAAMWKDIPEGNDERAKFYDRHLVGSYGKNANTGYNEWVFYTKGLNGLAVHVKY